MQDGQELIGVGASDQYDELLYAELRRQARRLRRQRQVSNSPSTTALSHDAYLRLASAWKDAWSNRSHFRAVALKATEHALIDRLRRRGASKRGAGWKRVPISDAESLSPAPSQEVSEIEDALQRFAKHRVRGCEVFLLRYCCGLTVAQTAEACSISPSTVRRETAYATAWLRNELQDHAGNNGNAPEHEDDQDE